MIVVQAESEDNNKVTQSLMTNPSSSSKTNGLLTKASPVSQKKLQLQEAVLRAAGGGVASPAKATPMKQTANLLSMFKKETPSKQLPDNS